jgi:predicted GH43/DUF377 family glycosyl hydrolase
MITIKFFVGIVNRYGLVICFLICFSINSLYAWEDLEERAQDFVLETKKIEIAGYPDAFNPTIIRWRQSLLLCFRTRDPNTQSTDGIGITWLDENFKPKGKPQLIDRRLKNSQTPSMAQDPRLIDVGGHLYMVYSNLEPIAEDFVRRVVISEVFFDGVRFFIKDAEYISHFEGKNDKRAEKNWVPFDYSGHLLLAYSIKPHRIFYSVFGKKKCEVFSSTQSQIKWEWGELRGGTPALINEGEYLAFFHSSKEMKTIHSNGKKHSHYFMGAYTFSMHPPFEITRISPEPIIGKKFYKGPTYNTWKPLWCIFPGGFVFNQEFIWVAYGRQDHEIWIVKLDKKKVLKSLIPVYSSLEN